MCFALGNLTSRYTVGFEILRLHASLDNLENSADVQKRKSADGIQINVDGKLMKDGDRAAIG